MVWLKCPKEDCGYKWDYKGNKKIQATCPDCMRRINIAKCKTRQPLKK